MTHPNEQRISACIAVLVSATALAGCSNDMRDGGQDVDLVSETSSQKAEVPPGSGPLWPLSQGRTWRTLTMRAQQANTQSEIRVAGTLRLPDGRSGASVLSTRNGKLFRVEVYQTEPDGSVKLLALGENQKKLLVFTPAIPFLSPSPKEGMSLSWAGTAKIDGKSYDAQAFHRLSAVDSVKTPFDTILAYRLDGIISLVNGSQRIDYPSVEWLVPGKGIAQRRLADRGNLALEVITKFSK